MALPVRISRNKINIIIKRKARAIWKGKGADGKGHLNSTSSVLKDTLYSFQTRFKNESGKNGTNPEELIAAAHAGCFAMALSVALAEAGFTSDRLEVEGIVQIESVKEGFSITGIDLLLNASVPNIEESQFKELAQAAKENCPVSKALKAVPISLDITFE